MADPKIRPPPRCTEVRTSRRETGKAGHGGVSVGWRQTGKGGCRRRRDLLRGARGRGEDHSKETVSGPKGRWGNQQSMPRSSGERITSETKARSAERKAKSMRLFRGRSKHEFWRPLCGGGQGRCLTIIIGSSRTGEESRLELLGERKFLSSCKEDSERREEKTGLAKDFWRGRRSDA